MQSLKQSLSYVIHIHVHGTLYSYLQFPNTEGLINKQNLCDYCNLKLSLHSYNSVLVR